MALSSLVCSVPRLEAKLKYPTGQHDCVEVDYCDLVSRRFHLTPRVQHCRVIKLFGILREKHGNSFLISLQPLFLLNPFFFRSRNYRSHCFSWNKLNI